MKVVANIIWFILFGLIFSVIHFVLGAILALSVVGIPAAMAMFEVAKLEMFPFGKVTELCADEPRVRDIIWGALFGSWTGLIYIVIGLVLSVTIVLIPFAKQCIKIAKFAYAPFDSLACHEDMLGAAKHMGV